MNAPIVFVEHESPLVSVIIIAWRSAPHIRACLESVVTHIHGIAYEVVLILNEPDDQLREFVDMQTTGIRTITTRVNVGYGGAVNLGVNRARGEFVVLLNDDAEVMENWLEPLVDLARRRPRAVAVGSTTLFPDGSIQEAGSAIWADGSTVKVGRGLPRDSRRYDYERRVEHCSGTSLLVRRSAWMAIGGMDAKAYYPAYYEDTDLCLRLIEAGGEVWYQPRSYLRHIESASTNFSYRRFLFEKNQAVFVRRWHELLHSHVAFVPDDDRVIDEARWRAMGSPVRVLAVIESSKIPVDLMLLLQAGGRCQVAVFSEERVKDNGQLCALGIGPIESGERLCVGEYLATSAVRYDLVVDLRERESREFDVIDTDCIPETVLLVPSSSDGNVLNVTTGGSRGNVLPRQFVDFVASIEAGRGSGVGQGEGDSAER
ncbi:MAG TPA: glycosyltransferase family 2 protein [Acidimicrobiales bacterium]|nr:glycosyltransferase family 2 protein [Acidimicrobiales bacterium]